MKAEERMFDNSKSSLHLKALSFYAGDESRLARFWAEALNWDIQAKKGRSTLVSTDDTPFDLNFLHESIEKHAKNRIHIDLSTTSDEDQANMVAKLTP